METLIGLVVIFGVCFLPGIITNYKFDNRISPNGYRVDYGAMNRDLAMGKYRMDIMRKCNNGGYDVKKINIGMGRSHWKIIWWLLLWKN